MELEDISSDELLDEDAAIKSCQVEIVQNVKMRSRRSKYRERRKKRILSGQPYITPPRSKRFKHTRNVSMPENYAHNVEQDQRHSGGMDHSASGTPTVAYMEMAGQPSGMNMPNMNSCASAAGNASMENMSVRYSAIQLDAPPASLAASSSQPSAIQIVDDHHIQLDAPSASPAASSSQPSAIQIVDDHHFQVDAPPASPAASSSQPSAIPPASKRLVTDFSSNEEPLLPAPEATTRKLYYKNNVLELDSGGKRICRRTFTSVDHFVVVKREMPRETYLCSCGLEFRNRWHTESHILCDTDCISPKTLAEWWEYAVEYHVRKFNRTATMPYQPSAAHPFSKRICDLLAKNVKNFVILSQPTSAIPRRVMYSMWLKQAANEKVSEQILCKVIGDAYKKNVVSKYLKFDQIEE